MELVTAYLAEYSVSMHKVSGLISSTIHMCIHTCAHNTHTLNFMLIMLLLKHTKKVISVSSYPPMLEVPLKEHEGKPYFM